MKSRIGRIPKRALYLTAAACLCILGFAAFHLATRASATSDPFQGISAAESAPTLPSNSPALAQMQTGGEFFAGVVSGARELPSTIDGHNAYVMPTTSGGFCLFVEQLPEGCDSPLPSLAVPVLFAEYDPDGNGPTGTTAYGIAEDGIDSIGMTVNGAKVTLPVQGNVFQFSGGPSVAPASITDVIANFDDGHSVPLK